MNFLKIKVSNRPGFFFVRAYPRHISALKNHWRKTNVCWKKTSCTNCQNWNAKCLQVQAQTFKKLVSFINELDLNNHKKTC